MSVIDDVQAIASSVQGLDHSDGAVKAHHDLLWSLVWRHKTLLGLTDAQLLTIGNGDMQARGGGTDKTPPPEGANT